jgi:hypothetical protein
MRTIKLLILLCTTLALAPQARGFTYWNDFRVSALLPGNQLTVRVENPQGPGLAQSILYADSGIQTMGQTGVVDGASTLEATVPGPTSVRSYYGFRLVQPTNIDLLAVRVTGDNPSPAALSLVSDDPVGDEVYGLDHLDLVSAKVSRDETRLYAALKNVGGGFPVSQGLTFFSYLLGITNPNVADPDTVFGMIQTVSALGIIEPGLYQINGTGVNDLVKLGEITATEYPAENTLVLSCLLADLEANPVFQAWYDAGDPQLGVAGFTQRISLLGGVGEADQTPGATWHLRSVFADPVVNTLPQLSDLVVPAGGSGGRVQVNYVDAEAHCPVIAEVVFDGTEVYALRPVSLDYGLPILYRSELDIPPLVSGSWTNAVVRFSDNAVDVVELTTAVSAVEQAGILLTGRAWPNPSTGPTGFALELPQSGPVRLAVYDLAGRRVVDLAEGTLAAGPHRYFWDGRDAQGRPQPAGVYFFRLAYGGGELTRRVVLLR